MEYRRLGNTGLQISALSFGAWINFGIQGPLELAKELLSAARESGVNFFDNAEGYGKGQAESIMGQAIKELGWKRSDIVISISTKLFWGGDGPNSTGLSRKHIIEGTKASLARLQMDYVDVLFCHCFDAETPIEETIRAMNWVIDQGWALYWGTSQWNAEQLNLAISVSQRLGLIGPACEQPEYNIFARKRVEEDFKPIIQEQATCKPNGCGLGLTTWSPLAFGLLTGKYSGQQIPAGSRFALQEYKWLADKTFAEKRAQLETVDNLKPIAEELGCTLAQLAIAWCLKNRNVSTVITGASRAEQLKENMAAIAVVPKLTNDIMKRIHDVSSINPDAKV